MRRIGNFIAACAAVMAAGAVEAHVPHIERYDYSWDRPLSLADGTLSIAVYGWLQSPTDYDVIEVTFNEPNSRLFAEMLVPVCPRYTKFQPQFAVLGPTSTVFSTGTSGFPFASPAGWAALVPDNEPPLGEREVEYEPFGGKSYYVGASLDLTVPDAGVYYVVVWNNAGRRGDYVLAVGAKEVFEGPDLVRALVNTQVIRANGELHTPCGPGASERSRSRSR